MNIIKSITPTLLCLTVALLVTPGYAEDIDIYSRPPVTTPDPNLNPNVLIILDNSTNWSAANQHWAGGIKQGEAELQALSEVISTLDANTNVGLMMFTTAGNSGGYIRFHVRQMTQTNKSAFVELIGNPSGCTDGANSLNGTPNCILKNFQTPAEKVSGSNYSGAMLDVFKYFGGHTWPAHAGDDVAASSVYGSSVVNSSQFGTQRYAGPDSYADAAAYSPDKSSYNSPLGSANSCAKNYVIFIGNGYPGTETVAESERLGPPSLLPTKGVGGDVTQLPLANMTVTTSTKTELLATPACGTYPGTTALNSRDACNAKAASKTFTVTTTSPAVFTSTAHGLVAGDRIVLASTGSLPKGLAGKTPTTKITEEETVYYVISAGWTADAFRVSLSAGGTAVNTSNPSGSGTHTFNNFGALYLGYSSYNCTSASSCAAGSTTTTTVTLPAGAPVPTACHAYTSAANCAAALPGLYTGYTSYSCTDETSCPYTTNRSPTYIGLTGCIAANNAANCVIWAEGNATYNTLYSGFSCAADKVTSCTGSKSWELSATYNLNSGKTYAMNGIKTVTDSSGTITYSQNINGTYTLTAAEPNGTFSAPAKINYFDEWARFLNQTDTSSATGKQNVNTFTINVFKDQQDADQTALLISAAAAGGGKYFTASNKSAIVNALKNIFSEIQSVNSVFASSSLPVSVNTQGTYLNQVFMGMFRPEGGAAPRWPGNLKQYKFKFFNGVLRLADKNGDEAISTSTGFVTPCADSYWSTDTGQYWNFGEAAATGGCAAQLSAFPVAGSSSAYSDAPDGDVVEKGGAAQRLRGVSGAATTSTNYAVCGAATPATAQCRNLLTCDGSSAISCTGMTPFADTNASVTAALSANLIWWTRGKDVDNENSNLNASLNPILNEMRPSVHGGVVHSQPAVVDYGGTTGTIAFYGADDGVFHAVDGGQTDSEGIELWGFVAPEIYSKLYRLRDNGNDSDRDGITSSLIAFPGIAGTPAPTRKDYFFDGAIGVYQKASTVWIYPSMRRGGRAIYAFDASTPTSPSIKWRKGCFTNDTSDNTSCSTDWSSIGQTWSAPIIAYLNGYVDGSANPKPVLIFGGGYDQCEDTNSQTRCAATPRKGANIWFVDADTGAIIRTYPTHYSVPGDLAVLKDKNGYLTYVYASDTGGNVYRVNVGSTNTSGSTFTAWSANSAATDTLLASLSVTNHARKFINGPSVVPTFGFNAVLLGSGDREHPLVTDYVCGNYSSTAGSFVTNQFYMLMDNPAVSHSAWVPSDLVDVTSGTTTIATTTGTSTITNVRGATTTSSTKGWLFNFGQCEQSVNEALTIAGATYFGTNAPSSTSGTSCTANLGIARGYAVDYLTGNPLPGSAEVAAAIAAAVQPGDGPGTGVGASGEVINGVIAGANGGSRSAGFVGGGLPPSPVAGVVDVDGTKYPFCIGCINTSDASASALQGTRVIINPTGRRFRPYWYIEND